MGAMGKLEPGMIPGTQVQLTEEDLKKEYDPRMPEEPQPVVPEPELENAFDQAIEDALDQNKKEEEAQAQPEQEPEPQEPEQQTREYELPKDDEETTGVYSEQAPSVGDVHDDIAKINKGTGWFDNKISAIRANNWVSDAEKTQAETLYSDFVSAHTLMLSQTINPGEVLTQEQFQHVKDAGKAYSDAILHFEKIKDQYYRNWDEMKRDVNPAKLASAEGYTQKHKAEIIKLTHNTFTRWINRKLMGFSSKKIKRMKIGVVNQLLEMGKAFDQMMNILEDKHSTNEAITQHFNNVSTLFAETARALWPLGKVYTLKHEERIKDERAKGVDRDKTIPDIRISSTKLDELANMTSETLKEELKPDAERLKAEPEEKKLPLKDVVKKIKEDIEPIFNEVNINIHPGGVLFDVKPLKDSVIAVVIKPNTFLKKLLKVQNDSEGDLDLSALDEWDAAKDYLEDEIKQREFELVKAFGYALEVHILE
jgi:hypothetical protein